jgi:hypothetical protein
MAKRESVTYAVAISSPQNHSEEGKGIVRLFKKTGDSRRLFLHFIEGAKD